MEIYFTLCQPMALNCGVLRRPVVPPIILLQVPMTHSHARGRTTTQNKGILLEIIIGIKIKHMLLSVIKNNIYN